MGRVVPKTPLDVLKERQPMNFAESQRLKHTGRAQQARRDYSSYRGAANHHLNQAFGANTGTMGNIGKSVVKGTAGLVYDLPRALTFSPASRTGLTGYLGAGVASAYLGTPDPYNYSLPDIAGKGAYLASGAAQGDAKQYAGEGAKQGITDMVEGYRGLPFMQRWGIARDPSKTGIHGNNFSQNPGAKSPNLLTMLMRNAGGLDESYIRQNVAQGVDSAFPKQASIGSAFRNMKGFIRNTHAKLPVPAKVGLGGVAALGVPAFIATGAYKGEQQKVQGTSYDQGYDSGQYKAQQYYQGLPIWQRALAAAAPDQALRYGLQKFSPQAPAQPTGPGYGDMNVDQPVTTMFTRPDGSEVY